MFELRPRPLLLFDSLRLLPALSCSAPPPPPPPHSETANEKCAMNHRRASGAQSCLCVDIFCDSFSHETAVQHSVQGERCGRPPARRLTCRAITRASAERQRGGPLERSHHMMAQGLYLALLFSISKLGRRQPVLHSVHHSAKLRTCSLPA